MHAWLVSATVSATVGATVGATSAAGTAAEEAEAWSSGVVVIAGVMALTMLLSAIGRAKQFRSRDD
ncbi:MAG: hypothetical protein F2534_02185 [Actinobacteria bacterium]|jgi:hypothetical protein|uniref:Unannotated protein n=1 Tax=freshwater metagenome TaxID=449393 RepID=A0A6J6BUP6_9ZZZZ|nr:hypothetical protein [Actinomycetota bacterium]